MPAWRRRRLHAAASDWARRVSAGTTPIVGGPAAPLRLSETPRIDWPSRSLPSCQQHAGRDRVGDQAQVRDAAVLAVGEQPDAQKAAVGASSASSTKAQLCRRARTPGQESSALGRRALRAAVEPSRPSRPQVRGRHLAVSSQRPRAPAAWIGASFSCCLTPIPVTAPAWPLCSATGSAAVLTVGRQRWHPTASRVLPPGEDPTV